MKVTMSEYERASVQRRIVLIREHIYTLGNEKLAPTERASNLRSAIAELKHLEEMLDQTHPQRTTRR